MRFSFVFVLIALSIPVKVWAQRNCATDELANLNKSSEQILKEKDFFENWLLNKQLSKVSTRATQGLDEVTIYQIPVVVHVIHRGEPLGVGNNIPEEQILSQIQVLNEDFRRLNGDSLKTPSYFKPVAADIGFEFVLAKQDPTGFKTNGITRTASTTPVWYFSNNIELKALSYWNSDEYLNIWVAPLGDNYLGWAEYPTSDILDGINSFAENNPLTDGVVIETTAFGSKSIFPDGDYSDNYFLGRTLTHEVGHFFGLRHIWGDGNCSVDDYVADTPNTNSSYQGCPPIGASTYSCANEPSMFMNYMDYVYDDCMNLFTIGQKERMEIIINNSPRRASLLTSPGLLPPPPLDIGITTINSPEKSVCGDSFVPEIQVVNNGSTMIMQIEIALKVNQVTVEQVVFDLNLVEDATAVLNFSDFTLPSYGTHQVSFEVIKTNGGPDDNPINNIASVQVYYSETVTSLSEEFTNWPGSWAVRTDAPISKWNISKAPNITIANTAAVLNYFENTSSYSDQLITPTLDLSGLANPSLLFDFSYAHRDNLKDRLSVVVSTDCGLTFTDTLFSKSGEELANNVRVPNQFTPSGPVDWHTIALDLSNYAGLPIQIGFVGESGGGNNIYLDNFFVVDNNYTDLSLKGLVNESGAFLSDQNSIDVIVDNTGNTTVNDIQISIKSGVEILSTASFTGLGLAPMERTMLELPLDLGIGLTSIEIELVMNDNKADNNIFTTQINSLENVSSIPFRETFSTQNWDKNAEWTVYSPGDQEGWTFANEFLKLKAFGIGNKGLHDWLVLPPLDFSNASEVGLRFRYAYALNDYNDELLRVLVSTNKGQTFDHVVTTLSGFQLKTAKSIYEWEPTSEDDWAVRFLDLSEFAGNSEVLVGFVGTDGDGNNIYLDDIEFFVSADPDVVELNTDNMAAYPNPVMNQDARITFNLAKKQDITVTIVDAMGNIVSSQVLTDVLNQTYPLEMASYRNGFYLIHATGAEFNSTSKVIVNQ